MPDERRRTVREAPDPPAVPLPGGSDEGSPSPEVEAAAQAAAELPDPDALRVDRSVPADDVANEPLGVEDVKDLDTTIGAAASGVLLEEDQEQATQRLHDVQVILAELGYLSGDNGDPGQGVTGVWDPETRDAVAEFQGDHELDATGQIDSETYEALLAEHELALGAQAGDVDEDEDEFSPLRPDKPLAD
jgi:murein L,D-transpeptidase YcbB/YkuD